MADAHQTQRVENVGEGQNLTYGHFGTAIYDDRDTHCWKFLRRDDQTEFAVGVGGTQHASHQASKFRLLHQNRVTEGWKEQNENTVSPSLRHVQRLGGALRHQPDLALTSPVLLQDEDDFQIRSHEQVPSSTDQQLICGYVVGVNSHNQPVEYGGLQILVWVAGTAGEELPSSILVTNERPAETNIHIHLAPSNAQHGLTLSDDPILQICFSRHASTDMLLGIRKTSSIVVLRPIWNRNSQETTLLPAYGQSSVATSLRWDKMLVLPISRTGGHPNSHLAFDGSPDGRLAVIDTHGSWSIWELIGKTSRSNHVLHKAHLKASGRLLADQSRSKTYEGWHRVCWLYNDLQAQSVLLVCDRCSAEVYNSKGETLGQVDLRLASRTAGNKVLDVQSCARQRGACIILTSTRILVMRLEDKESRERLELICSWSHYRGAGDLTLRMAVAELDDVGEAPKTTELHIVLYSKRSKEITLYTLAFEAHDNEWLLSASDPTPFPIPTEWHKQQQPIGDLTLTALRKEDRLLVGDGGVSRRQLALFARMEDGALLEAFYEYVPRGVSEGNGQSRSPRTYSVPGTRRLVRSAKHVDEEDDLDDFVVNDISDEDTERTSYKPTPKHTKLGNTGTAIRPGRVKHWADVLPDAAIDTAGMDFMSCMDESTQQKVIEEAQNHSHFRTIAEHLRGVFVDDIEEASEAAAAWLQQDPKETGDGSADQHSILPNPVDTSGHCTLLEKYTVLIELYVRPLSDETPDRMRVNAERMSRQVALEAFLAGFTMRGRDKVDDASFAVLPRRDMRPSDKMNVEKDAPAPGTSDRHTQANALSHLSNHNTITKVLLAANRTHAVSEILGHLPSDIGIKPSEYSFKDTELSLVIAKNEVDASLDPHLKKRAERLAKEERRKLERNRRLREEMALRTVPSGVMSSQLPQPGSSQGQDGQVLPMTQPERGACGGRDRLKKKGPQRMAGF